MRRAILFFLAAGCVGVTTEANYPDDLDHPNYVKRTKAAREFAKRLDRDALPKAFDLLMDPQPHIRAIAHQALRALTPGGRDFGYRAYLDEDIRAGIAERWRAFVLSGAEPEPEAADA